ncbi:MAG: SdpI family protein [Gammaproteobacteria bacterium]
MNFLQRSLPGLFTLVAMMVFSAVVFDSLPEQVPSSYSFSGEVTDTQSRGLIVSLAPALYLFILALVYGLLRISPEKFSMPNSKRAVDVILFGVGVMVFFIHVAIIEGAGDMQRYLFFFSYGMAAFLVITGNVFGKTERNFFIGIRLPWTIASAANWKVTHRLAGKLMVAFGLVLAVINTFYVNLWLMLALCIGPLLLPVLYSPWYYFKHEKTAEGENEDI